MLVNISSSRSGSGGGGRFGSSVSAIMNTSSVAVEETARPVSTLSVSSGGNGAGTAGDRRWSGD